MTRKKVNLAFISNDSARKATFKKRKRGLVKKVSELQTLCGIDVCAIIFSPYESLPEIWPSPSGVQHVLSQFKKISELDQSKKMVNQESFLKERTEKANEQFRKQRKENYEKKMTQVVFQSLAGSEAFLDLNVMELKDLGCQIEQILREVSKRIETLNLEPQTSDGEASQQQQVEKSSNFDQTNMEDTKKQQWFEDLMSPEEHVSKK